jgi:purine-cytosine permease-like protein
MRHSVYGIALPILLNMATLAGYAILGSILGGQTISAIDQEHVSVNVGIVIVSLICLVVIFFGFRMMHQFDLYAWIPTLVGFLGIVGYCGKDLRMQVDAAPASAQSVLSFASLIAGFFLPWSAVSSDFTTYFDGRAKM